MFFIEVGFGESEATRQDSRVRFEFETDSERNAFIDGIESAIGWFEYEVFQEGNTVTTSE